MNRRDDPLAGLRPVTPPGELRSRTLRAAREALSVGPESLDVWTRIARSRTLRLAWVAAVAVIVVWHVGLSFPTGRIAPSAEVTPRLASGAEPAVAELVRMAAIDGSAQPPSARRKENGS